ncbi:hypothetical protein OG897_09185 [Streptomyces sp. NBC_00237]|uniref:hypothetical protein n=1 Tax=Streptomyces sp. NBC_00237 TaxID=2975687 RepID=UPI0022520FE4|nr:hypothetical protein [Streptomyces sp. NBC_00237]MCX5201622.1 hypothetical protein [Streptomyces sp. NBC_00237]
MIKNVKRGAVAAVGALALMGLSAAPASAATYKGPSGCAVKTGYDYWQNMYEWSAKCSGRGEKNWRVTVTFEYLTSPGVYTNYTVPWTGMGGSQQGASTNARVVSAYGWQLK